MSHMFNEPLMILTDVTVMFSWDNWCLLSELQSVPTPDWRNLPFSSYGEYEGSICLIPQMFIEKEQGICMFKRVQEMGTKNLSYHKKSIKLEVYMGT